MKNLLAETLEDITAFKKTVEDVSWVGSQGFGWFTWDDFAAVADFNYDDGYGWQEVAKDLVIVFTDGQYMTRGEYDGSEWWEYHPPMDKPERYQKPTRVIGHGWSSLTELHSEQE